MITEAQAQQIVTSLSTISDGVRDLNTKLDSVLERMGTYADAMGTNLGQIDRTVEEIREGIAILVADTGTQGGDA